MILKQKALAIFDFLAAPNERLYERAARFHFRGLQEVLGNKASFDGEKTQVLATFPEVAAALGAKALEHPALTAAIRAQPLSALYLLLSDYNKLAPTLEPVVLTSAEATYYLLKAAREQKITLLGDKGKYLAALMGEPFWAIRHWGDAPDDALLAQALTLAKRDHGKTAAATYLHLYFNSDADPTDFVELLSSSPALAYLASRHFYDRGIEFKYFGLKGLTPRWAYHFITDGFLDDEDGLIDTMLAAPDWLVEYLVESERYKDLAYTGSVIEKANKKAEKGIQLPYLKLWWERVQEHVKKLPPPKPPKPPVKA